MTANDMMAEIRDANLSYLMLAQQMIRADKVTAIFRLGIAAEIADLIRSLEADIAVDLMGLTGECRTGIFARRPAPVQVNYLGFPGTMGAPFMHYILADATVIPPEHHAHYAEAVVTLPHCYLPVDNSRPIPAQIPSRQAAGLPPGTVQLRAEAVGFLAHAQTATKHAAAVEKILAAGATIIGKTVHPALKRGRD